LFFDAAVAAAFTIRAQSVILRLVFAALAASHSGAFAMPPETANHVDDIQNLLFGFFGVILGAVFIAAIVVNVFYLLTLQRTMGKVSEPNRPFAPGLVWLCFVPFFGSVWMCVYTITLSLAVKKDFEQAGRQDHKDGSLPCSIGMAVCLGLCWIPFVNMTVLIAYPILWIVYWVQIAGLGKKMPVLLTAATPLAPAPVPAPALSQAAARAPAPADPVDPSQPPSPPTPPSA
jgi:hypothetical protein